MEKSQAEALDSLDEVIEKLEHAKKLIEELSEVYSQFAFIKGFQSEIEKMKQEETLAAGSTKDGKNTEADDKTESKIVEETADVSKPAQYEWPRMLNTKSGLKLLKRIGSQYDIEEVVHILQEKNMKHPMLQDMKQNKKGGVIRGLYRLLHDNDIQF